MSFPPEIDPESPTYDRDVRSKDNIFYLYKGQTVYFQADFGNIIAMKGGYTPLIWMKMPLTTFSEAVESAPVQTELSRSTIVMNGHTAIDYQGDVIDNDKSYTIFFDVSGDLKLPVVVVD